MSDAQLLSAWYFWLAVSAVIVVIAAALLLAVLSVAKSIARGAGSALKLVKQIRENTQVIWALQDTNRLAAELETGANALLSNAGEVAQALHEADLRRGRRQA